MLYQCRFSFESGGRGGESVGRCRGLGLATGSGFGWVMEQMPQTTLRRSQSLQRPVAEDALGLLDVVALVADEVLELHGVV